MEKGGPTQSSGSIWWSLSVGLYHLRHFLSSSITRVVRSLLVPFTSTSWDDGGAEVSERSERPKHRQRRDEVGVKGGGLSILALFLRSYFVPFPFTYRILLSHEIDGVRKEKERLTASMFAGYSPRSCGSYPSHEVKWRRDDVTERSGDGYERDKWMT